MRARECPAVEVRFKRRVGHEVRAARLEDLDVVDQHLACGRQLHLQGVDRSDAALGQYVRHRDRHPTGLVGFVTGGPRVGQPAVRAGVDAFEAAAAAIRQRRPFATRAVSHFIHGDVNDVGLQFAQAIGADQFIRHAQHHARTRAGKVADKIAQTVRAGELDMIAAQLRRIARHHEILEGVQHGVRREGEGNGAGQPPAGEVEVAGAAVIQLDELVVFVAGDGRIHQLVDDDLRAGGCGVGQAGRTGGQPVPFIRPVGPAAGGNRILLLVEADCVEHEPVGRAQPDGLAGGIESKPERRFVEGQIAAGRNGDSALNHIAVRGRRIGDHAARQVERVGAAIVEFNVVEQWQVGVREHFIDQDRAQVDAPLRFQRSR